MERKVNTINKVTNDITCLGKTASSGGMAFLGLEERLKHLYVLGKTGSGKTTFAENLLMQDIRAGKGVCLIDPHGQFAENALNLIPTARVVETIYFNAADKERPVGFNPLKITHPDQVERTVSDLLSTFYHFWKDSWGNQMEQCLRATLYVLVEASLNENVSLLSITRFLNEDAYRHRLIARYPGNGSTQIYWQHTFPKLAVTAREKGYLISPIVNKLEKLSSPLMQNIIGQEDSTFDLERVINEGQILVVNLAKGSIGEENANLLGSLIISKIQSLILRRIEKPTVTWTPFFVYIDEFQNFTSRRLIEILSESRKFKLGLVLIHQYVDQISEDIFKAIKGNVEVMVLFAISGGDAYRFEREVSPFNLEELTSSRVGEAVFVQSASPRRLTTFGPIDPHRWTNKGEKIKRRSRERFARRRWSVEDFREVDWL